ncbi:Dabb family protein [Phycicoccus sp. BSK3Z-2]|uniref:Dabb family protein n=1 Tax=Phycicoccus avicenniae TaxID=2828860 RepID=A0A941HZ41_9MICO|nr:Dabb family protein [Phycicoccus avicenniae]MBR7741846.1 Dabb family protein [Phycicoccus avicenniae]
MIYHHNRFTMKADADPKDVERALDSLRTQGQEIPSVQHYVVGRDLGGEFEYGAVFAITDIDGFWEYLVHPAHLATDRVGLPIVESFVSYDTTDDEDPEIGEKIEALHARRYAEIQDVRDLVANLPSYSGAANPQQA